MMTLCGGWTKGYLNVSYFLLDIAYRYLLIICLTHLASTYHTTLTDYNIMDKIDELTTVRDEQTMTQYAYGSTGMVSYDDERAICDKTEYAQVHDLNGYIIWELSGDLMPDLTTPLLDAANAKLLDPSLDCASLDLSDYINEIVSEAHPPQLILDAKGNSVPISSQVSLSKWYANFSDGVCLNDGQEPNWLKDEELFDTVQDCCAKKFNWNDACVANSPDSSPVEVAAVVEIQTLDTYYPSSIGIAQCLNDGNQP